jgi:hypothetical protein
MGAARPAWTHRCGTTWAPSHAKGAPCLVCNVVGSGFSPRVLPLHGVRAQRCGHLVLRIKRRERPRCGSPVLDMSRNKRGYLQEFPTRATAALQGAAKKGVSVACVLVFVMHSCLCLCRLLQRDQHDHTCMFVFVMPARSCLCRLLQHPCRKEEDIDKGDGRSSRSLQGGRQPQHSGAEDGKEERSANENSANGLMALPIRGKTATWVPLQLSFLI